MLGKRDSKPTLLQKDIDQIKKVLKQMKYTSKSTISIVSQFYRLCNKKQSTIYYSNLYGRKSKNNESSYVEFMEIGNKGKLMNIFFFIWLIELLHGQIQYFLEIIVDGNIIPFAIISPIHWNNKPSPQVNLALGKVVTNLKPNDVLYFVPADQLIEIISLFPLQQLNSEEQIYAVIPYKLL